MVGLALSQAIHQAQALGRRSLPAPAPHRADEQRRQMGADVQITAFVEGKIELAGRALADVGEVLPAGEEDGS